MDKQLIRECERAHYFMQLSSYFSELTDLPFVSFAYTKYVTDTWYNQAYNINYMADDFTQAKFEDILKTSESFLSERDRETCFYLTPATLPSNFGQLLEKQDYGIFEEEAWMFLDNTKPPLTTINSNVVVKEVSNELLSTFKEVYKRTLPGPEVEGYIKCVVNGFLSQPPMVDIKYYVAFVDSKPIGMLSLLCFGKYAGLYAVAVDADYQKQGVCKALVSKAIEYTQKQNIEYLFLQTGNGAESQTAFEKLGFGTKFLRIGYAPQSVIENMQHG